jgi:signal transduction histidine kinase
MGVRIVVADDEPDILLAISERLRWLGHEVFTAGDGQAAMSAVASHSPDLVFLDVGMPRLSGMEALVRIRRGWPHLPVVIVTAYSSIQLAVEAMREGAIDFVTKPFEPGQVDSVVTKALERNALKTEMTQVLGEISHDVKNMLMPLVAGTDLLAEELDDIFAKLPAAETDWTAESHEMCDDVIRLLRSSSHRIHERMKEIADYVALSRAPRAFAPCRVAKAAESVVKALRVLAERNRITLLLEGLDTLPPILADENRLYSALYNLVHNAIPEVPAGGSITVRGVHDAADDSLELAVQDTGAGMPPEVRDSLFTSRVASRKAGGTGLGTKIVKDVVDAHGGRITVESEVGKGTTFRIRLPLRPPSLASESTDPVQSGLADSVRN